MLDSIENNYDSPYRDGLTEEYKAIEFRPDPEEFREFKPLETEESAMPEIDENQGVAKMAPFMSLSGGGLMKQ